MSKLKIEIALQDGAIAEIKGDRININNLDLSNIKLDKPKKSFLSKLYFKIIDLF